MPFFWIWKILVWKRLPFSCPSAVNRLSKIEQCEAVCGSGRHSHCFLMLCPLSPDCKYGGMFLAYQFFSGARDTRFPELDLLLFISHVNSDWSHGDLWTYTWVWGWDTPSSVLCKEFNLEGVTFGKGVNSFPVLNVESSPPSTTRNDRLTYRHIP